MSKSAKLGEKILEAEIRKIAGRKVKKLRQEGILPGNIFGKKVKSLAVQTDVKKFQEIYKKAGETGLVELKLGGEVRPVLIHNLQVHAKTDLPLHVDFLQVDLKEKVEAGVPIELVGGSPAEKQAIGTVVQQLSEIKVESLPADLPEKFEVNIESLADVDQAIYVKDLIYDKSKIEIKGDLEAIIAKVEPPQKEEVIEVPVPAEGEVPTEEVPTVEGETPAEEIASETPKEEPRA